VVHARCRRDHRHRALRAVEALLAPSFWDNRCISEAVIRLVESVNKRVVGAEAEPKPAAAPPGFGDRLQRLPPHLLPSLFLIGAAAFTLIFIATQFLAIGKLVSQQNVPLFVAIEYFLYEMPAYLLLVIPMAMLFGTLLSVGRLSGESEITALKAGGIGLVRAVAPLLIVGLGVSFVALGNGSGDLQGRQIFPADNPWNADISAATVDPNSNTLIASCGASSPLHPDFGTVYAGAPNGIPYVVVHGTQSRVPVTFTYASESDPGPYPVPAYAPIEGGPTSTGDRHVLVLDWDNWRLYEMYAAQPAAGGTSWSAGSGAVFDLRSDSLRPAGWTSADAAGLPILPGLVRYDEVVLHRAITHAFRFTCPSTRHAYVSPARHYASSDTSSTLPPMGMRVRLKASVNISGFSPNVQVILRALQHYGMFVADNGSPFYISGAPDPRRRDDDLHTLTQLHGSDFEVVQMQGIVTQ